MGDHVAEGDGLHPRADVGDQCRPRRGRSSSSEEATQVVPQCTALTLREAAMQDGGAAETPAAGGASPPALDWGAAITNPPRSGSSRLLAPSLRLRRSAPVSVFLILAAERGTRRCSPRSTPAGSPVWIRPRGFCRWHGPGLPATGRRWISFRGTPHGCRLAIQCGCHPVGVRRDLRARSRRRRAGDVTGAGSRRVYRAECLDPRRGHV